MSGFIFYGGYRVVYLKFYVGVVRVVGFVEFWVLELFYI